MKPLYMQFSALNSEDAFGYVNVSIRLDGSIFGIRYSQVVIGHHAKWNSMRLVVGSFLGSERSTQSINGRSPLGPRKSARATA